MNVRYRCPSFYEIGSRYAQLSSQPSLLILLLRYLSLCLLTVEPSWSGPSRSFVLREACSTAITRSC